MELMSAIAEGRSQASPQLVQTYRKPILRMLEETRGLSSTGEQQPTTQTGPGAAADPRKAGATLQQSSSLSVTSLSKLSQASRKVAESTEAFSRSDPPNSRQQVTSLLDSWIRVHNEAAGNDKVLAQYLQILQQFGVGKVEEHTERFFRLSALVVVEAVQKTASTAPDGSRTPMNYNVIDIYCKLLLLMFRHLNAGGTADQVKAQRLSMLNKILGVIVRTMMWDAEKSKKGTPDATNWDQRPWFRLFVNLVIDMNKPDEAFAPIRLGILSVFGAAFHVCQPLVMPGMYF
jgi:CCR4-NOT transcription complex subunit 1